MMKLQSNLAAEYFTIPREQDYAAAPSGVTEVTRALNCMLQTLHQVYNGYCYCKL
jgi:hypothetical protein